MTKAVIITIYLEKPEVISQGTSSNESGMNISIVVKLRE
jgi:hypothetical protein